MTIWGLWLRELRYRWGVALAASLAVAAGIGAPILSQAHLAAYERETAQLMAEINRRSSERIDKLLDDVRVFSKSLGYNLLIIPASQPPDELYRDGKSRVFFDESLADSFAREKPRFVNHVLPFLRARIQIPELGGEVAVLGIRGQTFRQNERQEPIMKDLGVEEVRLGDELARRLGTRSGAIQLWGRKFEISDILPQSASQDDVTVIAPLAVVQEMSGLAGKISGFFALSCNCQAGETEKIEADLARFLPDPRVIEFLTNSRARSEARRSAAAAADEERRALREDRSRIEESLRQASDSTTLAAISGACAAIFFLMWIQASARRSEAAILRALGRSGGQVAFLLGGKLLVVAAMGIVLGVLAAWGVTRFQTLPWVPASTVFSTAGLVATLTLVAGLLGLWRIWRQDPARSLQEER